MNAQTHTRRSAQFAAMSGWAFTRTPEGKAKQLAALKKRFAEGGVRRHKLGSNGKLRGKKWKPETVEKRAAPMRGRPQKAEKTKAGPTNQMAVRCLLNSPWGEQFEVVNISFFVREHEELFLENPKNAIKRLLTLVSENPKIRRDTWQGWTGARLPNARSSASPLGEGASNAD